MRHCRAAQHQASTVGAKFVADCAGRAHDGVMTTPRVPAELQGIFTDPRGGGRGLKVSWHQDADVVVFSLWRANVCAASFRLAIDEVPDLIAMLREGLDVSFYQHRAASQTQIERTGATA